MKLQELIKQLRMIQNNHKGKEIKIKIGMTLHSKYQERELELQDLVETNYDGTTNVVIAPLEKFF